MQHSLFRNFDAKLNNLCKGSFLESIFKFIKNVILGQFIFYFVGLFFYGVNSIIIPSFCSVAIDISNVV